MNPIIAHIFQSLRQIPLAYIVLIGLLASVGFTILYSAAGGDMSVWATPQIIRFSAGFVVLIAICLTPIALWMRLSYWFYGLSFLLLIGVEVFGHVGMGAQRWIDIAGIRIQPSEMSKIAMILTIANYFHHFPPLKYRKFLHLCIPAIIILLPVALILKQPNLGTATLLSGITVWMMFAAGVHKKYFLIGIALVACSMPVVWHNLHDYQKQRVQTFLDPGSDPLGSGYNISQSIIAIGSGGISGKGLLEGSQTQLDFLPEKQTDFVFTVLAEEFGFMGGIALIILYSFLILHTIAIAYRCSSLFGTLIAHGVAAMLTLHMFINIGMVMGILPVVGIPLPLVSYGGSNMITVMVALGLSCNAWIYRDEKLKHG